MGRNHRELPNRKTRRTTRPLQFTVRSFLIFTTFVSLTILTVHEIHIWYGPVAAAVAILACLSIFAHIAGAAIGARLRSADSVSEADCAEIESPLIQPMEAQATDFAPATQLSHQAPLDRKPMFFCVGAGASLGAIGASVILTLVMWDDLRIANVLFGACSASVIGGLFGFWLGSLYQVARKAIADAQESP